MSVRWILAVSLLLSACAAAADVSASQAPDSLDLADPTTSTAAEAEPTSTTSSIQILESTSSSLLTTSTEPSPSTTADPASTTATPSSTAASGSTLPAVDPLADFCAAASDIVELGNSVSLDDPTAAAAFFRQQSVLWADAGATAPAEISTDAVVVATFYADMEVLLVENDFDLFAVFAELEALEASSRSDLALIRTNQFIYANCDVEIPSSEQATAAFYGTLLDTAENRGVLAELLASAEVFSLDGATCFVGRATPDVMHPLVDAPSTPDQESALASVLSACQISIGTL